MSQRTIRASNTRHLRDTWLWIRLPMVLLILLIAALLAVVIFGLRDAREAQTSVVADMMLSVFILCPAVICMLPLTLLTLASVVGLSRVHGALARPLGILQGHSETLVHKTQTAADNVNSKTISISSRFGFVYRHLGLFEQKSNQEDIEPHG